MQKSIASFGGHLLLRAVISALLAGIVYISFAFIFTSLGTEKIGYTVYRNENGTMVNLGNYYYADLDELEASVPTEGESVDEETGETVTYYTQSIRSDMPGWMKVLSFILSEICMIGMYTSMLYVTAWEEGAHDRNHVRYDRGVEDKNRGLKAGLFASVPCIIVWVFLLLSKCFGMFPTFGGTAKLFFLPFFPIVTAVMPTVRAADVALWAFPLLLVLMAVKPLTCHWAYRMGYADKTLRALVFFKGNEKAARKAKK